MGGMYDDNFYFHNPVDYLANLSDPWVFEQLASCEIRLVTGSGPWEKSHLTYALSQVLARKGIRHYRGRLGPPRRARLAVLEGRDAGVSADLVTRYFLPVSSFRLVSLFHLL